MTPTSEPILFLLILLLTYVELNAVKKQEKIEKSCAGLSFIDKIMQFPSRLGFSRILYNGNIEWSRLQVNCVFRVEIKVRKVAVN